MKNLTATLTLITASLVTIAQAGASAKFHQARDAAAPAVYYRHRRHHVRAIDHPAAAQRSARLAKRAHSSSGTKKSSSKKCKPKKTTKTAGPVVSELPSSSSSSSSSSSKGKHHSGGKNSTSTAHCPSGAIVYNGVCVGMLPDGGTDGGPQNTMSQLNALVKPKTNSFMGYFGQYAQITSSSFDGGQLKQVLDDLKGSGAIFQPAVMPTNGFSIFTPEDNSGAKAVCNVMKEFTDEGIDVWLRFAHECNWYVTDGTYKGSLSDCKTSFQEVAKACKTIAPKVKMFWTPNMGDMGTYDAMWPGAEYVDYIGIDFYPKQGSGSLDDVFVQAMKPLHDKYTTSDGPFFAMGETGLAYAGSPQEKAQFFKSQLTAKDSMPNHVGTSWFNYIKYAEAGGNFKILDPNDQAITQAFLQTLGD